jgi:hypothetical protein
MARFSVCSEIARETALRLVPFFDNRSREPKESGQSSSSDLPLSSLALAILNDRQGSSLHFFFTMPAR